VHVTLTGEQQSYYQDFEGLSDLAKALTQGFVYDGKYSSFRKKRHGNSPKGLSFEKFIVFIQNHDQIGNRPLGDRLSTIVGRERLKVAACLLLMTPSPPMLFMGEEYGERAAFEYFVDYEDERLMQSVYEGRKREIHRDDMSFPGEEAFNNSQLTWSIDQELFSLYRDLIALRKKNLPKPDLLGDGIQVDYSVEEKWITWEYQTVKEKRLGVLCYLGKEKKTISFLSEKKVLFSTQNIETQSGGEWVVPSDCAVIFS